MAQIIPPVPPGSPIGSSHWADWYEKVRRAINDAAQITWAQFSSFAGSSLVDLETRNHNDLQTIQGGTTNEYYHLTATEHGVIASGIDAVIVTAKITGGGSDGSMTFTKGILTAQTPAT